MLRTVGDRPSLWESILPEACLGMPGELEAVDRLLDDRRFFEPYRRFFHATLGRPSIPMETYLRLMFLKYRYRLGFEPLCREVADSITWRRSAGSGWVGSVPHPTTLMKITTRCGQAAVDELHGALIAKAVEAKVLKLNRVRADTTVVEANVAYPTDSGLLTKGIAVMGRIAAGLKAAGLATRTRFRDRSRSARCRCRAINANLRRRRDDQANNVRRIKHRDRGDRPGGGPPSPRRGPQRPAHRAPAGSTGRTANAGGGGPAGGDGGAGHEGGRAVRPAAGRLHPRGGDQDRVDARP
jgi:transposase, IS5 family